MVLEEILNFIYQNILLAKSEQYPAVQHGEVSSAIKFTIFANCVPYTEVIFLDRTMTGNFQPSLCSVFRQRGCVPELPGPRSQPLLRSAGGHQPSGTVKRNCRVFS